MSRPLPRARGPRVSAGASEVLAAPHLRAQGAEAQQAGRGKIVPSAPTCAGAERRTLWEGTPEPPRGAFASRAVTPIGQRVSSSGGTTSPAWDHYNRPAAGRSSAPTCAGGPRKAAMRSKSASSASVSHSQATKTCHPSRASRS